RHAFADVAGFFIARSRQRRQEKPKSSLRGSIMSDLILVSASNNRLGGHWPEDDYDLVLVETGQTVGRIYARIAARGGGLEWWWGFTFPHALNASQPFHGIA